jgi:hypothetical protein
LWKLRFISKYFKEYIVCIDRYLLEYKPIKLENKQTWTRARSFTSGNLTTTFSSLPTLEHMLGCGLEFELTGGI